MQDVIEIGGIPLDGVKPYVVFNMIIADLAALEAYAMQSETRIKALKVIGAEPDDDFLEKVEVVKKLMSRLEFFERNYSEITRKAKKEFELLITNFRTQSEGEAR